MCVCVCSGMSFVDWILVFIMHALGDLFDYYCIEREMFSSIDEKEKKEIKKKNMKIKPHLGLFV